MKLAFKFFFDFFIQMGFFGAVKLGLQFIPDAWNVLLSGKIPKLILMVEFEGKSEKEIHGKLVALREKILHFGYKVHIARSSAEAQKYWKIRRESFNLLRKHSKGKRTAPFIDDIIVKPEFLPVFLPKIQAILDEYKLVYTIAGHPGNGNFHIIPLMNLSDPFSADTILDVSKKVYDLVHEYHGSITAEHNDGIIRTPYLLQMFGADMISIFEKTKNIFDPENIFNPGKKVGGTFDDIRKAIAGK
jgi:FAD/FMN-containing dehydrogenase